MQRLRQEKEKLEADCALQCAEFCKGWDETCQIKCFTKFCTFVLKQQMGSSEHQMEIGKGFLIDEEQSYGLFMIGLAVIGALAAVY